MHAVIGQSRSESLVQELGAAGFRVYRVESAFGGSYSGLGCEKVGLATLLPTQALHLKS